MTAYEINVTVPALDNEGKPIEGETVADVMIVEAETKSAAEDLALERFPEGTKVVRGGIQEVPTVLAPVPEPVADLLADVDPADLEPGA